MKEGYLAVVLTCLLVSLGGCDNSTELATTLDDESEVIPQGTFQINIDSPAFNEVLIAPPVRVLGEVSNIYPIESVTVNGIEQDVSLQTFIPGDGELIADQYSLAIDTNISLTDIASDIAGLTADVGSFDPGSNKLIISATDDRSNRVFLTRTFALGEVRPVGAPSGLLMSTASALLMSTESNTSLASALDNNAAEAIEPESEIENAIALGLKTEDIRTALRAFCEEISPVIGDALRNELLFCQSSNEENFNDNICSVVEDCCSARCDGGDNNGETCKNDSACGGGGSCVSNCGADAACAVRQIDEYSPVSTLVLNTPTHCDPAFTFGINYNNMTIDSLRCDVITENGLLTLTVKPQIRALEITARGECGLCIDIGGQTLESVTGGVNLEVAVDIPTIRFALRDWENDRPIDPADLAYERFLTDSLTTLSLENIIVGEAVVKDFIDNRFSSEINAFVISEVTEDPEIQEILQQALDPSRIVSEEIRIFVVEWLLDSANTKAEKFLDEGECKNGDNDNTVCTDDSECTGGGSCEFKVDPDFLERVASEFALDSFQTTPEGLSVAVKGKFSPALFDPEVEITPGGLSTPADAPIIGMPGAENSFVAVADDTFNQLFATVTVLGDIKQACFAPTDADSPKTVGEFLGNCNTNPAVSGAGFCVGVQGGNCESLLNPADQGICHSLRGDNCAAIPVSPGPQGDIEKQSCNNGPKNISADMPLLYCSRADIPPSLWIRDDVDTDGLPVTTPNQIETHVRINDLLIAVVVDRQADQMSNALPQIPDCADNSANQSGDCKLIANCLDVNVSTNVGLITTTDSPAFKLELLAVQQLQREAGVACAGGVSFPAGNQLGLDKRYKNVVDTTLESLSENMPNIDPVKIPLPLINSELIALQTTQANAGFDDYLGISVMPEASDCGNGVCDTGETCGYSEPGACSSDCGLCKAGDVCDSGDDCDTDRCVANNCQTLAYTALNNLSCDGDCFIGGDCFGGVCNFGLCTTPNSLPALSPCSTGAVCKNGSCPFGLCEEICGDGFCDGTEQCGGNDSTLLQCRTDCGQCGNGELCGDDGMCQSGLCNAGICTGPQPNGTVCVRNEGCLSGVCNGVCVAPNSVLVGEICLSDAACRSGVCNGICQARCGDGFCDGLEECGGNDSTLLQCRTDCGQCGNGELCGDDGMCQSGFCNVVICTAPQPNGNICVRDEGCISGNCKLGFCQPPCGASGSVCFTGSECCSNSCGFGIPPTCD